MLAGEGTKKVAEAIGNLAALGQDSSIGLASYDRHEIDVGMLVETAVHHRAAGQQCVESIIELQFFDESFEKSLMQ